jgi:hypothetical protein
LNLSNQRDNRYFIRVEGHEIGWIYTLGTVDGQNVFINELIPGDFIYVKGNHDFYEIAWEQYKGIHVALGDGRDPAALIQLILKEVKTNEGSRTMILHEVNAALSYLLKESNDSIEIHDTEVVYADEVIHYLSQLFNALKYDYRVIRLSEHSYQVYLFQ